jgi:RNA polymerase sigma-70 factor (family 1)
MQSFQKGEEKAFDELFREYASALSLFAFKLIGSEKEAEDIVQDCFVSLWERRKKLDDIRSIKSYLYTSIRYRCVDFLKKNKIKPVSAMETSEQPATDSLDAESLIILAETAKELYKAIDSLPVRMQQVVRLYYLEDKSYREIGEMLHTDPETVRNQRFKAIQFIRKTIIPG